jgi:hypothetical protein
MKIGITCSNGYEANLGMRKLTSELGKRGYDRDGSDVHNPKILGVELLQEIISQ